MFFSLNFRSNVYKICILANRLCNDRKVYKILGKYVIFKILPIVFKGPQQYTSLTFG